MTGFARREVRADWGSLSIEMRSVNHRYLEVSLRLPEEFRALDPKIRKLIGSRVKRGKIDCSFRYQAGAAQLSGLEINQDLVGSLLRASKEVAAQIDSPAALNPLDVLRWPGVVDVPAPDLATAHTQAQTLLGEALDDLIGQRESEGERLHEMIESRCTALAEAVEQVSARREDVLAHLRQRLEARLAEVQVPGADPGRLEQEMVMVAQRLDVDEELDRLGSHITEAADTLQRDEPVGRRLDFLMQEFNREANTLSSKSSDAETTRLAVDMKVLIEQMREQVQNIE